MKKLFLILLVVLVSGCEKAEVVKFNDSIQGTWSLTTNKFEYFDEDNQKDFEDMLSEDEVFKEITFYRDVRAQLLFNDGESLISTYDLFKQGELAYVEFGDLTVFDTQVFEITNSSSSMMIWKVKFTDIKYENVETGETKVAPYAILTLHLKKID